MQQQQLAANANALSPKQRTFISAYTRTGADRRRRGGGHCWRIQRETKRLPRRERARYIAYMDRWIQAPWRRFDYPPWWINQAGDGSVNAYTDSFAPIPFKIVTRVA
jgi:hypothetical protein